MDHGIEEFWAFWRSSERAIERAIEDHTLDRWVDAISGRVDAIHPRLDWEFGQGLRARHYFCVSAVGDSEIRVVAERWRAAGPGDGPVFEFHAARPGGGFTPATRLEYAGVEFCEGDFRVSLRRDDDRARIHVAVHHPSFAQASEDARLGATWVTLDTVLGEDDVERWVGRVELLEEPPADGRDLGGLVEAVAELRAGARPGRISLLRGKRPSGAPTFALVDLALKRVDHLLQDVHYEIALPLRTPTPHGLTTNEEGDELNALEDELVAALGPDAILIGHETHEGVRLIHLHASATGPVPARLEAWRAGIAPREALITATHDPQWAVLSRW